MENSQTKDRLFDRLADVRGFTAAEFLIVTAIGVLGLAAVMSVLDVAVKSKTRVEAGQSLASRRAWFVQTISNASSWKATLTDPANVQYLNCVSNGTACAGAPDHLRLIGPDGSTVMYDEAAQSSGQTVGVDPNGRVCYGFSATAGNAACPMQYQLRAQMTCVTNAAGVCNSTQIKVIGSMAYNAGGRNPAADIPQMNSLGFSVVQSEPPIGPEFVSTMQVYVNKGSSPYTSYPLQTAAQSIYLNPQKVSILAARSLGNSGVTFAQATDARGPSITYAPSPDFYGVERVEYVVQEDRFGHLAKFKGVITFKVMTPFTWIGLGNNGEMRDEPNWCGDVVNGRCAHNVDTSNLSQAHMVFNDTCELCDVDLGRVGSTVPIGSVELSSKYVGTVRQISPLRVWGNVPANLVREPTNYSGFYIAGGTFVGYGVSLGLASETLSLGSDIIGGNSFTCLGGSFTAPAGLMKTNSDVTVSGGCAFAPNGGTFAMSSQVWWNTTSMKGPVVRGVETAMDLTLNDCLFQDGSAQLLLHGHLSCQNMLWDGRSSYVGNMFGVYDPLNPKSGTIDIAKDVTVQSDGGWTHWDGTGGHPSVMLVMSGATDQTINGHPSGHGYLSSLKIDKPSGILTLSGRVSVGGALVYKRGSLNTAGSTLIWGASNANDDAYCSRDTPCPVGAWWGAIYFDNESGAPVAFNNVIIAGGINARYERRGSPVIAQGWLVMDVEYNGGWGFGHASEPGAGNGVTIANRDVYFKTSQTDVAYDVPLKVQMGGAPAAFGAVPAIQNVYGMNQAPLDYPGSWASGPETCCGGLKNLLIPNVPGRLVRFNGVFHIDYDIAGALGANIDFSGGTFTTMGVRYQNPAVIVYDPSTATPIPSLRIQEITLDFTSMPSRPKIVNFDINGPVGRRDGNVAGMLGDVDVSGTLTGSSSFGNWYGHPIGNIYLTSNLVQTVNLPTAGHDTSYGWNLNVIKTGGGVVNQTGDVTGMTSIAVQNGSWVAGGFQTNPAPSVSGTGTYAP